MFEKQNLIFFLRMSYQEMKKQICSRDIWKCFVTVVKIQRFEDFRFHLTKFDVKSELFVLNQLLGFLEIWKSAPKLYGYFCSGNHR